MRSMDGRDMTPEPPAYLEPLAVLISARAVVVAKDWPYGDFWLKPVDWRMVK